MVESITTWNSAHRPYPVGEEARAPLGGTSHAALAILHRGFDGGAAFVVLAHRLRGQNNHPPEIARIAAENALGTSTKPASASATQVGVTSEPFPQSRFNPIKQLLGQGLRTLVHERAVAQTALSATSFPAAL